jgi:hypothetical protein
MWDARRGVDIIITAGLFAEAFVRYRLYLDLEA